MKNEDRAAFSRAPEPCDFSLELPPIPGTESRHVMTPILRLIIRMVDRMRSRRDRNALLALSDDQLKDIGLSRSDAYGGYSRYRRGNARHIERKCL
jgi:uncharacterized protein YjiS (DUF1127 family)